MIEDDLQELNELLAAIARLVPRRDSWDGGAGRLEDIASLLDTYAFPRPDRSNYQPH